MAWNSPSDKTPKDNDQQDKDPWTGKPKAAKPSGADKNPPMLDDLCRKALKRIHEFCKKGAAGQSFKSKFRFSKKASFGIGSLLIILIWALLGITHVLDGQSALLYRLGVYQYDLTPGWYWIPVGVEDVQLFDSDQIYTESVSVDAITQDANLAHLNLQVTYKISQPKLYALSYRNSRAVIQSLTKMAILRLVASNNLDALFSDPKSSVLSSQMVRGLNQLVGQKQVGIQIEEVSFLSITVPEKVKETFDKLDALYQEQLKQKHQAQEYEKQHLPEAQTKVDQMLLEARNYAQQVKLNATQEVSAFLSILPSFDKEPELTRHRVYDQTMAEILSKTTKVVLDEKAPATSVVLPPVVPQVTHPSEAANVPATTDGDSTGSTSANTTYGGDITTSSYNTKGGYGS